MKSDIKRKILEKTASMTVRKTAFTLMVAVFLIYRFVFAGGVGIMDRREKIPQKESYATEEKVNDSAESMLGDVKDKKEEVSRITVYITGAVASPGVVSIDSDKRLDDAIRLVGGVTDKADTDRINLAMKIEDSQHYIIPEKGDNTVPQNGVQAVSGSDSTAGGSSSGGKININTADEKSLEEIPGVGPSTSKKIVDYRTKEGKFSSIDDIKNVSGIGDKKFENMKEYIDVK